MDEVGGEPGGAGGGYEFIKLLGLLRGLGAFRFIGHGEVRKNALHSDQPGGFKLGGAGDKGGPFGVGGAVTAQPGIGLKVHYGTHSQFGRGDGDRFQVPAGYTQANVCFDGFLKVGAGCVEPRNNGCLYTFGTQFKSFGDVHHRKHVGARFKNGTGNRVGAVPVGVGFDNGDELPLTNTVFEGAHVMFNSAQIDNGGSFGFAGLQLDVGDGGSGNGAFGGVHSLYLGLVVPLGDLLGGVRRCLYILSWTPPAVIRPSHRVFQGFSTVRGFFHHAQCGWAECKCWLCAGYVPVCRLGCGCFLGWVRCGAVDCAGEYFNPALPCFL